MLVLSRKTNESIVLGDGITIKVLRVRGGGVRLGIAAPADVSVRRAELPPAPAAARSRRPPACVS